MPYPKTPLERFDFFMNSLSTALGHADRNTPLRDYCSGLLLPGERKSVEPMAARIDPFHVQAKHQSMHHFIANASWSDDALMKAIAAYALPAMETWGPIEVWIVDDTGFPKKGSHSVGVTRQYCGRLGKQENCQVAVSVSIAHANASLPVAFRLYLPETWAADAERRRACGVPETTWFQTKPTIALSLIERLVDRRIPTGVVLADAGYGNDTIFRHQLTELGLQYAVGIQSVTAVWPRGTELPPPPSTVRGRPRVHLHRDADHQPIAVEALAERAGESAFEQVQWREGSTGVLSSRFWATRVRSAHIVRGRTRPTDEEWLLVEWPEGAPAPTKYWLATLPENITLRRLVYVTKMRWRIERDYEELKSEIGLGHFEGRGWTGFHHHATICIAAYAFLVAERGLFPPQEEPRTFTIRPSPVPKNYRPRGAGRSARATP